MKDLEIDDSGCSARSRSLRRDALDRTEIVMMLRQRGRLTSREVAEHFTGAGLRERGRSLKLLNDLLADGFVRRLGCGVTHDPYMWVAVEETEP